MPAGRMPVSIVHRALIIRQVQLTSVRDRVYMAGPFDRERRCGATLRDRQDTNVDVVVDTSSASSSPGERTVPGIPAENYWFRRHEAAYEFALPYVAGRSVLEVGCGEGYGTALLASSAGRVLGVDYDALTVAHAAASYPRASFVRANLAALPVPSASVDVLTTLQVVEHVWNHPEFVQECLRVLRPGGLLLVTTPNRLTFSPGLDEPVNPFHTREFTATS